MGIDRRRSGPPAAVDPLPPAANGARRLRLEGIDLRAHDVDPKNRRRRREETT